MAPLLDLLTDIVLPGVPLLEKVVRPVLVYAFLIVALRLFGRRELGQMNPFDLVVLLTLSNTVQNAIIGNDNSVLGGVVGAMTLLATNWLVVRYLYVHPALDRKLEGEPTVLVRDGVALPDNLRRELITEDELRAAIRRQGVESLDQVRLALLETSGTISVFAKHPTPDEALELALAERLTRIERLLGSLAARDGGGPA
jgi:uncharacterized membrane protein YcaP (DUF421 family)